MAQAKLRAVEPRPPRSPERQALADQIEKRAAVIGNIASNEAAQENQRLTIRIARRTLEEAAAAVAGANEATVRHLTKLEEGVLGEAPLTSRRAREIYDTADADLADAQEVLEALKEAHAKLTQQLGWLASLRDRVGAVVASEPGIGGLLARFEHQRCELESLRLTLQSISLFIPHEHRNWDAQRSYPEARRDPAWSEAIMALESDADAPLPETA